MEPYEVLRQQGLTVERVFLFIVVVQVPLSIELSRTPLVIAVIRSLASMQTHVRFEIALFVEGFGARFDRTDKVTIPLMFFKMDLQTLSAAVRLSAALEGTLVVFVLFVRLDVVLEVASRHECFFAVLNAANERFIRTLKQIKTDKLNYGLRDSINVHKAFKCH